MALLGRVLEERTGRTLAELLEARVAGPLGLEDTRYDVKPEDRSRLAPPHRGTDPIPVAALDAPRAARAAGGVYSTAEDLLRFLRAALDGDTARLGGPLALMARQYAPTDEDALYMGLGWKIHQEGARRIVHHGGESAGHQAFVGYDPGSGVGVVLLADSRSADDLDRVALHLLDPRIPLPDFSRPPETTVAPEVLASYAGRYAAEGDNLIEIGVREGRLLYTEWTPGGDLVRETTVPASSDTEFFFLEIPATLEFLPGDHADGRVLVLRVRGDVMLRAPRLD
jgi:CubicO group peptidase (beta-lactamase class C family)